MQSPDVGHPPCNQGLPLRHVAQGHACSTPVDAIGADLFVRVKFNRKVRVGVVIGGIVPPKGTAVEQVQRSLLPAHEQEVVTQNWYGRCRAKVQIIVIQNSLV